MRTLLFIISGLPFGHHKSIQKSFVFTPSFLGHIILIVCWFDWKFVTLGGPSKSSARQHSTQHRPSGAKMVPLFILIRAIISGTHVAESAKTNVKNLQRIAKQHREPYSSTTVLAHPLPFIHPTHLFPPPPGERVGGNGRTASKKMKQTKNKIYISILFQTLWSN